MRKALVLVVVALFALGAFSAGVQAASEDRRPSAAVLPSDKARALKSLSMPPIKPPACNPANAERYIKCLDRYLTKLSKNLNRALADLANLYDCFIAVPVSQYGIPPSEGYVYSFPDNTTLKTEALQFTIDPAIDLFDYFALVKPECVA